jgi:hypothetical protein
MSLKKNQHSGNMGTAAKKPKAQRSRRSGVKKAELIKSNQETIANVWTYLNQNQLRNQNQQDSKNF